MSANHPAKPTPIQNGHKRSATGKIVPAVPLPMSKPRRQTQAKTSNSNTIGIESTSQPKRHADAKAGAEEQGQNAIIGAGASAPVPSQQGNHRNVENGMQLPDAHPASSMDGRASASSKPLTPDNLQSVVDATRTPPAQAGAAAGSEVLTPSLGQSPSPLDMHSVKSGLPPSFTPSAGQQTPRSATSSRARQAEFPAPVPIHSSRPSASSIVFGSHDINRSSSATQPSSDTLEIKPPFYPPLVGYSPSTIHSHPQQTSHLRSTFPPHSIHSPPFTPFSQQQMGHKQPPAPHHHAPQSSQGDIYPQAEPLMTNGHQSRSASQSSSALQDPMLFPSEPAVETTKAMIPEGRASFPEPPLGRRPMPPNYHQLQQAMPPPPDFQANIENAELIRDHIRTHFNNPDLADCHLQITDRHGNRRYLDGHKIILSRSPTLMMLIQSSEPPQSPSLKTQVHVHLSTRYVTVEAFLYALRYLYGEPPMTPQRMMNAPNPVQRMRVTLEDAAVAVWLKTPMIMMRALDMAASQMHWETINDALGFALEGGLSPMWLAEDMEDRCSTDSSDELSSKPEASGMPTYGPAATELLHRIIDFMLHMFPPNFFVDIAAPQLEAAQRLPPLPQRRGTRQSLSNPRLSQIRFGEMETNETRPSPVTTLVSSILLSIPFPILKVILEHPILTNRLGIDTVASIMRAVIFEREARRNKALTTRIEEQVESNGHSTAFQNLYWVESVEISTQHRAGFRLSRHRRGIDTPASSGDGP